MNGRIHPKARALAESHRAKLSPKALSTRDGTTAELFLYDFVGSTMFGDGLTAKSVAAELAKLDGIKTLNVRINSEGGDVFEGKALYNLLARFPAKKRVYVDGVAASIASVIAMAGDEIVTAESATWMIHSPWTLSIGDAEAHEEIAAVLRKEGGALAGIYAKRTGLDVEKVLELMAAETWMNAVEAKELGFTDSVEATPNRAAQAANGAKTLASQQRAHLHSQRHYAMNPQNALAQDAGKAVTIEQLQAKLVSLADQAKTIQDLADLEQRSLTGDEIRASQAINATFREVEAEIDVRRSRAEMEARLSAPARRLTQPSDVSPQNATQPVSGATSHGYSGRPITGGMPAGSTSGTYGFRSLGEWAIAARHMFHGRPDQRIMNAPATFGSEGTNADGGFAVPPDFRENIMKLVLGEESLLSRTDQFITSSNKLTMPLDSTTPWQTSGGVLTGWIGEGVDLTLSKPALGQLNVTAYKAFALVPMTDELLEDVPAMTRYLSNKVPDKFTSTINDAIVAGDGTGKPQGLLFAACKIVQTAEAGQGAGTVVARNILKMWGRLYARFRSSAVWLINQDVEQQLQQLTMPGTNPSTPAYMPPGGFSQSPFATLLGRPIIPVEACKALGTEGDIILTDLSQYCTVLKAGGMRQDVSIHLYFGSDHTAFRFIMRVGGQSFWPAAITRQNGANTLSPIVTLSSTRT